MKFYDRKNELSRLKKIERLSYKNAKITIIVGRRRIGKTTLLKKLIQMQYIFL